LRVRLGLGLGLGLAGEDFWVRLWQTYGCSPRAYGCSLHKYGCSLHTYGLQVRLSRASGGLEALCVGGATVLEEVRPDPHPSRNPTPNP